jgi:hypothetical protein
MSISSKRARVDMDKLDATETDDDVPVTASMKSVRHHRSSVLYA